MANALFDLARKRFLEAQIDWGTGTGGHDIRAHLVRSTYTVDLANHEFTISLGANIASTSASFTAKATTGGAADAADLTFTSVTGAAIGSIVIYRHITDANDSPMIAYIDTATGLPITPNGGDIIVTWDNGANKIFKL